tara:strand:- start:96 stop:692 length:597 start_codon:yes stop_codon:yes gene_type:complete
LNICKRPIILIHGLWNTSAIFNSLLKKLDYYHVDYYAPTLEHYFGRISIVDLAESLDELISKKYGNDREIDILGFSMGGIIARYWIKKFNGYLKTKRFISIGSPHCGTLTAQFVPRIFFKGISEMKINSPLLKELSDYDYLLQEIDCVSFYTRWDFMVFPGWKAYLPIGKKFNLNIYKHKNLVRSPIAIKAIIDSIIT